MARTHHFFAVVGLSLLGLGTGCVSSEKYAAQRMRADQTDAELSAAQGQVNTEAAKNQLSTSRMAQDRQMIDTLGAIKDNQAAQITELTRQLEESNGKYQLAMSNIGKAGSSALPMQLVNELTNFAQQNPNVVEFDDKKGLVKFKSDVAFSAGSAVVKPEVKSVIDTFAGILNGPMASQYELLVVGHTDSTPVSNPATKRAGHLDNWYLSCHRAIAVSSELQSQGTSSRRIEVAGYADQRPVAPNDTDANKARNRRVEVFILPTTLSGSPAPVAPAPAPAATAEPAKLRKPAPLNKDVPATVETDKRPIFNK